MAAEDIAEDDFGDFDKLFGEGADDIAPAVEAPLTSPGPPGTPLREEDLFGDFDSGAEDTPKEPVASKKRPHEGASSSSGPGVEKKVRRKGDKASGSGGLDASRFFELEAEEAGDGSGDEDDADDIADLIDDSGEPGVKGKFKLRTELQRHANAELEEVQKDMDSRGPEMGARRVFGSSFLDRLQEKYEQMEAAGQGHAHHRPLDASQKEPTTTHIVPAPQDPKLWRCKSFADEKQLCISLMHKAAAWLAKGQPVPISSVFFSQHQRGFIYVEAFREAVVREFCRGIRGISAYNIVVVPLSQMPQVFTSSVMDSDLRMALKVGDYVRYKRLPYVGDLAQIQEINDEEYVVRLKPRIQYKLENAPKVDDKESRQSRKRPAARWFHKTDLEAAGVMVNVQRKGTAKGPLHFYVVAEDLYRDGFLVKTVKITGIETGEQVRPQAAELEDWRLAPAISEQTRPVEDLDREEEEKKMMPPPLLIPQKAAPLSEPLVEGDIVVVNAGELRNLRGRVVKAIYRAKTVTVRPFEVGMGQDLELAVSTLCKFFEVGDYVKVIGGDRQGDAGYVMAVNYTKVPAWHKDAVAMVLASSITAEFEVRLDQLRLTAEKSEQALSMQGFTVGDVVFLSGNTNSRGLIVRIETTCGGVADVLTPTGERVHLMLSELTPIINKKRQLSDLWTLDRKQRKITIGCVVQAPRGHLKAAPVRAEVIYIHNDTCFLRATEGLTGERAYLVCSGKKTEFVYDGEVEGTSDRGPGRPEFMMKMKDEEKKLKEEEEQYQKGMLQYSGIKMASETQWIKPWFKEMMGIKTADTVTQKGANVRITGGGYKGLRAEVRDFLQDKVRVSLLCKPKLVTIPMKYIAPDDYVHNPRRLKRKLELAAPGTPALSDDSSLQEALSPIGDDFAPKLGEEPELNSKNSWDPKFLIEDHKESQPSQPRGSSGPMLPFRQGSSSGDLPVGGSATPIADGGHSEDEAPLVAKPRGVPVQGTAALPSPAALQGTAAPPSPALSAASGGSKRRKRQGILPEGGNATPRSAPPSPSPGRLLEAEEVPATRILGPLHQATFPLPAAVARAPSVPSVPAVRPWLVPGVGVHFTPPGKSEKEFGWILETVSGGDMITVVPDVAILGNETDACVVPGTETEPWICERRSDVLAFAGPRLGSRGKVIGVENNVAYFRPEKLTKNRSSLGFASITCKDIITVQRMELARYSPEWLAAHAENLRPKPPRPAEDDEAEGVVAAEGLESAEKTPAHAGSALLRAQLDEDGDGVVVVDGEVTPDLQIAAGVHAAQLAESPLSVGEITPFVVNLANTPPVQGWTPDTDGDYTPGVMGWTPMTPMPGAAAGGVTPMPPMAHIGVFTPRVPGMATPGFPGGDTPLDEKVKTMPGGETPMAAFSSALGGSETPFGKAEGVTKGEAGGAVTPSALSSGVKGDTETGGLTPFSAGSVVKGDETPGGVGTPAFAGAVTPGTGSESAVKGDQTPGSAGSLVKGEETPGGWAT